MSDNWGPDSTWGESTIAVDNTGDSMAASAAGADGWGGGPSDNTGDAAFDNDTSAFEAADTFFNGAGIDDDGVPKSGGSDRACFNCGEVGYEAHLHKLGKITNTPW